MAILSKRIRTDAALAGIDAALAADVVLCFCGCGRLVDETRPSMYFYAMSCSDFWHASQLESDPAAWRAEQRAGTGDVDLVELELRQLPNPPLVDLHPRPDDGPSPMDMLDGRSRYTGPSPLPGGGEVRRSNVVHRRPAGHRPYVMPDDEPVRVDPGWGNLTARMRRILEGFGIPTREQARELAVQQMAATQQEMAHTIARAAQDGSLMASLEELQLSDERLRARLQADSWSVTYVGGSAFNDVGGGSTWRVDVGRLSEHVRVGPEESHQRVVMACVERLRALQNGRIE